MGPKLTQALRWFSHFSIRSRSFRHGRRPRRSPLIKHSTKWRLPEAVPPPLLWLRAPDTNSRGRDARLVFVSRFFLSHLYLQNRPVSWRVVGHTGVVNRADWQILQVNANGSHDMKESRRATAWVTSYRAQPRPPWREL